ncbi:MAG: hypothetical protein U5J83_14095 [Bryobacterales bacterium]|nr:hypothetical protein [Bryobacterales bacterium]
MARQIEVALVSSILPLSYDLLGRHELHLLLGRPDSPNFRKPYAAIDITDFLEALAHQPLQLVRIPCPPPALSPMEGA